MLKNSAKDLTFGDLRGALRKHYSSPIATVVTYFIKAVKIIRTTNFLADAIALESFLKPYKAEANTTILTDQQLLQLYQQLPQSFDSLMFDLPDAFIFLKRLEKKCKMLPNLFSEKSFRYFYTHAKDKDVFFISLFESLNKHQILLTMQSLETIQKINDANGIDIAKIKAIVFLLKNRSSISTERWLSLFEDTTLLNKFIRLNYFAIKENILAENEMLYVLEHLETIDPLITIREFLRKNAITFNPNITDQALAFCLSTIKVNNESGLNKLLGLIKKLGNDHLNAETFKLAISLNPNYMDDFSFLLNSIASELINPLFQMAIHKKIPQNLMYLINSIVIILSQQQISTKLILKIVQLISKQKFLWVLALKETLAILKDLVKLDSDLIFAIIKLDETVLNEIAPSLQQLSSLKQIQLSQQKLIQLVLHLKHNNEVSLHQYILLLAELDAAKALNNELLVKILSLSPNNFNHLTHLVNKLSASSLLDEKSFATVFTIINSKLPEVPIDELGTIDNESQSSTDVTTVNIKDKANFFTNGHYIYMSSLNCLKQGFADSDCKKVKYSVKYSTSTNPTYTKREAKLQHLMQREVYWFKDKNNFCLTTEWLHGVALGDASQQDLKALNIQSRLKSLLMGFKDLDRLHQTFRVHGDIKPDNFIINLHLGTLRLIDFGSVRKGAKKYNKGFPYTPEWGKNICSFSKYNFSDDIYSMGLTSAFLFPDIYRIVSTQMTNEVELLLPQDQYSTEQQAIISLIEQMLVTEEKRCSCETAIKYCQELLNQWEILDHETVISLQKTILQGRPLTISESLHR